MKTVRVRIAVAIAANGKWNAAGWEGADKKMMQEIAGEGLDQPGEHYYWIEADVPVPETVTVEGRVE